MSINIMDEYRERDIENYLKIRVKRIGGELRKCKWLSHNGAPDRFIAYRGAHFAEIKAPGKPLKPYQALEHRKLEKQGVKVWVLDTFAKVDEFIESLENAP